MLTYITTTTTTHKGTIFLKLYIISAYVIVISLIAAIVTAADKKLAKQGRRRVPERTLFLISAMGGSLAMYLTMKAVRHKTKHKRFMIGIPLIMLVQAALIAFVVIYS